MSKSKVLFILHLPPPIHGAAMVGEFIRQSEFLNSSFDCDYINLQTSRKLTDTGRGLFNKFFRFVALYFKVISALFATRYDLCYMTLNTKGAAFYKEILIVFLLKSFRKKIVYHFHNKGVSNFSNQFINNLLYKFVFSNTQSILTSRFLYDDIKKYVQAKNVFYCPNGIPPVITPKPSVLANSKNAGRPKILFLSNMIKDKGVWILLEACQLLHKRKVDFECHFAGSWGDINETEFSQNIVAKGLSNCVISHGRKVGIEKFDLLVRSDIFALPTFNDCFPLVLLEAMQFSLPIITTYEGGIPEIVKNKENGILIPKGDIKELADKLEILILNPELCYKMGEFGKKRFDKNFTLKKFESTIGNILKHCAKE
jgi:glycosyltransferase involved in cell wall biosynthesis